MSGATPHIAPAPDAPTPSAPAPYPPAPVVRAPGVATPGVPAADGAVPLGPPVFAAEPQVPFPGLSPSPDPVPAPGPGAGHRLPAPPDRVAVALRVGVILPTAPGPDGCIPISDAARRAEALDLDSVWVGDHLTTGRPVLDAPVALATAAAVTGRVGVGISTFVPALRSPAWAAKQVATLTHLASGRFVLGVGAGSTDPAAWEAVGVPMADRARRTDHALARLPGLLAGRPTPVHDDPWQPPVTLAPAVPLPPVWVGGNAEWSRLRAVAHGDAWFPSLVTPAEAAAGLRHLEVLAQHRCRPVPEVAVGVVAALGPDAGFGPMMVRSLVDAYGMSPAQAAAVPVVGGAWEAAERFAAYARAGVRHVVVALTGDWRRGYDVLAEARRLARAN